MDAQSSVAIGAFAKANLESMRRTAYLLAGDWHRADDLVQDTLIRLAGSLRQVRDPVALPAYVRTCMIRALLDQRRRPWRRERSVAEPPDRGLDDAVEGVERRTDVLRALQQVPPRQRAVLVCRFYEDLDIAATAAALGCSTGTVKSQTARGLAALRAALGYDLMVEGPIADKSRRNGGG